MPGVGFWITLSYAILSVILYFIVTFIICTNKKKIFKGSYYTIILVDSAVNVLTYVNSLYTLRLPRITSSDSWMAPVFTYDFVGINVCGWLYSHFAFVQYLMILSLILNRFTAVAFPMRHERFRNKNIQKHQKRIAKDSEGCTPSKFHKYMNRRKIQIWKVILVPLLIFDIFGATFLDYKYFTVKVYFSYSNISSAYSISTFPDISTNINNTLVPSMIALTVASTILMIITFAVFRYHSRNDSSHAETKLLIYSAIYFLIQLFATGVVIAINIGLYTRIMILLSGASSLLPYVSDALTFCSPYILIFCSPTLRRLMFKKLMKTVPFRWNNEVSSVVTVMPAPA